MFSRYELQRPDIGGNAISLGIVLACPEAKKRRKETSKWEKTQVVCKRENYSRVPVAEPYSSSPAKADTGTLDPFQW